MNRPQPIHMDIDPEVLFHRYFGTLSPKKRENYWGKYDLTKSSLTDFERLLIGLQHALNDSLRDADKNVKHHVNRGPFYVDYIDSNVENAHAFHYESYSFIGITEPLMYKLWTLCASLDPVAAKFLRPALKDSISPGGLGTVLFRVLLFFVVAHEYTHHVHGHVSRMDSRDVIFNEISSSHHPGDLEGQALEIDADGYAAFLVINNLLHGGERELAIPILGIEQETAEVQDNILFSCFVMAVGAYFYHSTPITAAVSTVYGLTHPPQAARMNWVMLEARRWCSYYQPGLGEWMTNEHFNFLMSIVAEATWGAAGSRNWADQTEFFRSRDGAEYLQRQS
jgi:hypothetical protein